MVLTAAIALVTIALGDLNTIAALVAMFFLVSYGLLNYATYVEAVGASPSFRPRFSVLPRTREPSRHRPVRPRHADGRPDGKRGGIGRSRSDLPLPAVGCGAGQLARQPPSVPVPPVKEGLRQIAGDPEGPTDWQPHILAFTETPERRERVLRVAAWVAGGSGMITAVQLVQGDGASPAVRKACEDAEAALGTELERYGLDAYPLVVAAPDLRVGATTLLQSWGVGPIQSNTVLLNWFDSRDPEQQPQLSLWYARLLQRAARLDQHVVVLDADDEDWQSLDQTAGESRRIDVWWFENDSPDSRCSWPTS